METGPIRCLIIGSGPLGAELHALMARDNGFSAMHVATYPESPRMLGNIELAFLLIPSNQHEDYARCTKQLAERNIKTVYPSGKEIDVGREASSLLVRGWELLCRGKPCQCEPT